MEPQDNQNTNNVWMQVKSMLMGRIHRNKDRIIGHTIEWLENQTEKLKTLIWYTRSTLVFVTCTKCTKVFCGFWSNICEKLQTRELMGVNRKYLVLWVQMLIFRDNKFSYWIAWYLKNHSFNWISINRNIKEHQLFLLTHVYDTCFFTTSSWQVYLQQWKRGVRVWRMKKIAILLWLWQRKTQLKEP